MPSMHLTKPQIDQITSLPGDAEMEARFMAQCNAARSGGKEESMSESSMPPSWPFARTASRAQKAAGHFPATSSKSCTTGSRRSITRKLGITLHSLYSLVMLVAGGIEILLIRLQLAGPRLNVVPAEVFNRLIH